MTMTANAFRLTASDEGFSLARATRSVSEPRGRKVVVRVGAASLNYRGLIVHRNAGGDTQPGLIPLSGGAGTIEAIVISSSDAKLERAKALGGWRTINYREQPHWDTALLRQTDGEGAYHILKLGGPDTFERSIMAVATGGNIAQIGVMTGFGPTPNLLPLQFKDATIHGLSGFRAASCRTQRVSGASRNSFERGSPVQVPRGVRSPGRAKAARHFGKLVITIAANS